VRCSRCVQKGHSQFTFRVTALHPAAYSSRLSPSGPIHPSQVHCLAEKRGGEKQTSDSLLLVCAIANANVIKIRASFLFPSIISLCPLVQLFVLGSVPGLFLSLSLPCLVCCTVDFDSTESTSRTGISIMHPTTPTQNQGCRRDLRRHSLRASTCLRVLCSALL